MKKIRLEIILFYELVIIIILIKLLIKYAINNKITLVFNEKCN